ncbi:MAG: AzlC family ABC transporter permease [Rhodoferax sp.]|nr:AzlC family ABC transporter permease [Rhodoferax sp.]
MVTLRTLLKHPQFRLGCAEMAQLGPGIAAWGLMTGVAMGKSGLGTAEALLMALTVFAGSAQLAAIPLMLAAAPLWVIVATAFCVNLRFVVFSVHMRNYLMHLPLRQRLLCGYLTGDLTYVLFVKHFAQPARDAAGRQGQIAYLWGNGAVNWSSWTFSCSTGVVLANLIPTHWGLGFAGILALVGVTCSLASTRLRWLAGALAAVVAVAAFALPLKLNILLAISAAVAVALLLERSPWGIRARHRSGSDKAGG